MAAEETISQQNAKFWKVLCGSLFAERLGIKDHSEESLQRFDRAFLDYYPYLLRYVDLSGLSGKKVLEVGLGYGTLSQKIAEAGAIYTGLDISEGPVEMVNYRLQMKGLPGKAIQGSILQCPLESDSMDYVIAIGCYHHTGNVIRSIDETYRVLKPGGTAIVMVYSRFSYLQWIKWPGKTLLALLQEFGLYRKIVGSTENQRWTYDCDIEGNAAPETVFLSQRQLRGMFDQFTATKFFKENHGSFRFKEPIWIRNMLLATLGRFWGVDTYIVARK